MLRAIGNFLWFVFLVFLAMAAGWWILSFLDSKFSGNIVGRAARTAENLADPS